MTSAVEVVFAPNRAIADILARHPKVGKVETAQDSTFVFRHGGRDRRIVQGFLPDSPGGLIELADNNPLVCADVAWLPSPAGTLALAALGPLFCAGVVVEPPTFTTNAPGDSDDLGLEVASTGWTDGVLFDHQPQELADVYAAIAIAAVTTPSDLSDIDDLFEERYSRSFFVRRDESSEWDVSAVKGSPFAVYRLRISADELTSLLTIQIMADAKGKCGAAQAVHMMNVMCGFEESLGIE